MSNNEIVGDFMKNTVMPLAIVAILGIVLSPFCKVGEKVDFGVLFIYCSFPFGIYFVRKKFRPDKNIKTFAKVVTVILNVIGGCAIGVGALAWTLGRAFGYIPYTLWRCVMKDGIKTTNYNENLGGIQYGQGQHTISQDRSSYGTLAGRGNYEDEMCQQVQKDFSMIEDPLMDEKQIEIMKKIQELSEKRK